MSGLPKAFSNPSISSTSQVHQEAVERSTLCVTLLSREWRSSTDRDLSTVNRELAIQLAKHPGVQVSVFLPQCSEDDKRIAASHNVQLIEAEEMTGVDPVDWLINLPEDHAMDCIIGHGVNLGRQIPVIQQSHQCKWIQIVHNAPEALAMYKSNADAISRGEKMQQTEIELCELADQVVAVGPKLADTYRRFLRSSEKHQDVIDLTPSIFTEFLDVKQAAEERQTFCVLVTGSGDSEDFNLKGYDLAARAIADLKENSYQLKFVCAPRGKGEELAEKLLKHDIDRSQLIVRSFNESRETLARLFCEVDLAVMPSRSEGFGLTALEALSAGLPVLVSGNTGLGEALTKVPTGSSCVVDSEDPKHWASKIRAVREKDRNVRLAESKFLREKYFEKYSWQEPCGILVEKMRNLVTGSSGQGIPPLSLQHSQPPTLAGTQTPAQTFQTSHPQSSGYRPSSMEYCRIPSTLAGQTHEGPSFQTWHSPGGYSQLPFHAATQTHGEPTYPTSHHPESSSGWLPSSIEYGQWPSAVATQIHQGSEYQRIYSQRFSVQGRPPLSVEHNQLPFPACSQTPVQTSRTQSHHAHGFSVQGRTPLSVEHNQLPFPACSQIPVQTFQTQSHDPHEVKRTLPSSFQSSLQDPKRAKLSTSNKAETSLVDTFDMKTCQRKLAEYYQRTAKVPTTVWSSVLQVDLEKIYTRLSWVKQEQTTAGSSRKELSHYTEIFTKKTKSGVAKRILVQGETGIGKTTFVKKLLLDWSNLEEAKMDEEQRDALKKFDLVVSINLKEVSKCQTFKEVLGQSRVFPDDETSSIDDLLSYIGENQDKVLLVFDGYDEYRTGSEAEEKYGSRSNSPIYKIFHGNILRDCTVLVTTRSSRADELQECADMHADITGFNWDDREAFMLNFLGSQTEVDDLCYFLLVSNIYDLARVPLLNLFFCLLWKEEKKKLREGLKSKTELFRAILKHLLQHSRKRHSPSNSSELIEADYNEILTEIGKVALEGLLRGDLLFTFGQLSEKVRGEKSVIVGLLQVSESGPSLEPKEMVSFIHKSIQEYLAAWFVTYRCVPEGHLGGIEQHACTVEDCFALENVFQFVSGLSDQGAEKVFEHFSSVGTRYLSVTIPDADNQTDLPLYDLTERHWRFSDFAFNCFREVNSRTELLCRFFDCFGDVVPVPNHVLGSQFMPNVEDVPTLAPSLTFAFRIYGSNKDPVPCKSERFSECFHIQRVTESGKVLRVGDFLEEFQSISGPGFCKWKSCSLHFILRFRSGQLQFYITNLFLSCEDHARLLTETSDVYSSSFATNLCLKESSLEFTRSLQLRLKASDETMQSLGRAISNCRHLNCIHVGATTSNERLTSIDVRDGDSVCHLLEQVPNPCECSLKLGSSTIHTGGEVRLTSAGAVKLASLLPRFNNVSVLNLSFVDAEVNALVTSISQKSLKNLRLNGINLTLAAATTLGQSLPEMSTLESFEVTGVKGRIVQRKEMEALFGGFYKTLPLEKLTFGGFRVKCCLSALVKSFRFFPNLKELFVGKFSMDEHNLCCLLESLRFIPNLTVLKVQGKRMNYEHSCGAQLNTVSRSFAHETLQELVLSDISLNATAAAALGRSLTEMSSLRKLELSGMDGKMLQAEEVKVLFGGLNKTAPLLPNSLGFFPNLYDLRLGKFNMDEQHLCGLMESLRVIPNLWKVCVEGKRLCSEDFSSAEVNTVLSFTHETLSHLALKGISLTPTAAAMLGRSLPTMSSLETLELTGHGSVVPAEQMKRLFDGFNEASPLLNLRISGFNVRGCLAPLTRRFSSFPNLESLKLTNLNMDEHDLRGLLESFQFIAELRTLTLSGNLLGHPVTSIVPHFVNLPRLEFLWLEGSCSEEDFKSLSDALSDRVTVLKPRRPITFKT